MHIGKKQNYPYFQITYVYVENPKESFLKSRKQTKTKQANKQTNKKPSSTNNLARWQDIRSILKYQLYFPYSVNDHVELKLKK